LLNALKTSLQLINMKSKQYEQIISKNNHILISLFSIEIRYLDISERYK